MVSPEEVRLLKQMILVRSLPTKLFFSKPKSGWTNLQELLRKHNLFEWAFLFLSFHIFLALCLSNLYVILSMSQSARNCLEHVYKESACALPNSTSRNMGTPLTKKKNLNSFIFWCVRGFTSKLPISEFTVKFYTFKYFYLARKLN